ncbi:MAG: hypothetical protein KKB59_19095 [Spirochaetes bacterium]|nr:hypothetical protein [Spirochaetota bacterium]
MRFTTAPCEFGKSRIFCSTYETYLNYLNFYNAKADCFVNTHNCSGTFKDEWGRDKLDRNTIIIERVPFDLDKDNAYQDAYKLHCYLEADGISHTINFSGQGYHVFIYTKPNPQNTILDILMEQNSLIKHLNLEVDPTIIGNPSHMIRIPGTYNPRRERFCISLYDSELELGHEAIRELAIEQRNGTNIIGTKLLELKHYQSKDVMPAYPMFTGELKDIDLDIKLLIPCLTINIRTGGYIPHSERVWIAQYLSELYRRGKAPNELDKEEFDAIVEKIVLFFKDIVSDYNERITRQQVRHIVRNYSVSPSCAKFKALGKCITGVNCWRR